MEQKRLDTFDFSSLFGYDNIIKNCPVYDIPQRLAERLSQ